VLPCATEFLQQGFGIVAAEKHMGVLQSQGAPALGQPLAKAPFAKGRADRCR
jgi:hypothetical protein